VKPFAGVRRATVEGLEIAYRRAGSGRPVVLLHGIPTSSRLWDGVGADLAADHDVIAPDMVGFGESAKPLDRDVSITAQAGYLAALLEVLGLDRVTLVGHDIGGGAAQVFAVEHGERLDALGLVDAVCFDSWPVPEMKALRASAPLTSHLPPGWVTKALEAGLRREVRNEAAHESIAASLRAWDAGADSLAAFFRNADALDARHTEAVAPRLGEIAVPVHIVWGRHDRFQSPGYAERLRDAIPGATVELLDAGHFVPWERPAEVARQIRALVSRP
jgi:pimeloyl-ACP methyl ester carboxylesterase